MNKQLEIKKYLSKVPFADLEDIYDNVTFSYYSNHKKHLGVIMSRMVKNGSVVRLSKGLFSINPEPKKKIVSPTVNQNQLTLSI